MALLGYGARRYDVWAKVAICCAIRGALSAVCQLALVMSQMLFFI